MSLMPRRMSLLALATILSLPVLAPVVAQPLFAQAASGTSAVTGTVLDPGGDVLPKAIVLLKSDSSDLTRNATADSLGHFSIAGLPAGRYTVSVTAPGFSVAVQPDVQLLADQSKNLSFSLNLGNFSQQVTVDAGGTNSVAAQLAPLDAPLDERSARAEVGPTFIQNYTAPTADFGELVALVPGTETTNSNGVGLGQSNTSFRGFSDGSYDIDFDGIPFYDTNTPSHHSWAFFPSQWIGGVDFDRSPGTASTIGPTPFGGSIHLLSKQMTPERNLRGGISYGSFNTFLFDGSFNSGDFGGANKKSNLFVDVHHMSSDGYQTLNYQTRNAGSLK
ncbi:MAG: TonB-dependent receptor, partial [Edaphobacter sp.]